MARLRKDVVAYYSNGISQRPVSGEKLNSAHDAVAVARARVARAKQAMSKRRWQTISRGLLALSVFVIATVTP